MLVYTFYNVFVGRLSNMFMLRIGTNNKDGVAYQIIEYKIYHII